MVRSQALTHWSQKPALSFCLEIERLQIDREPKGKLLCPRCGSKPRRDPRKQRKMQSARPAGITQRGSTLPNGSLQTPLLCCRSYIRIRVIKTWVRVVFLSVSSSALSFPLSQNTILVGHLFKFLVGTCSFLHFVQTYSPALQMP